MSCRLPHCAAEEESSMINIFFDESTYETVIHIDEFKSNQNLLVKLFLNYETLYENLYSEERKAALTDLFEGVYDKLIENSLGNLNIIERLPDNTNVCLWYSDFDPNDLISLYFFCHILFQKNINIFVQRFPSSIHKNMQGWWSMGASLISTMKENIRELTEAEIISYDNKWFEILNTKSQLRISKDGLVLHVEENYYDDLIQKAQSGNSDENLLPGFVFELTDDCIDSYWIINRYRKLKNRKLKGIWNFSKDDFSLSSEDFLD